MEISSCSRFMEGIERFRAALFLRVAEHVHGDPAVDMLLGAYTVDGFLHLAVTAIAAFYGIGRGRQQAVIQKGQRFLQVRRLEFS